jgi:hypothetical protein
MDWAWGKEAQFRSDIVPRPGWVNLEIFEIPNHIWIKKISIPPIVWVRLVEESAVFLRVISFDNT